MRFGFISFRLAGSDGVSLETAKLTQLLAKMGHSSYYFAGELDSPSENPGLIQASTQGSMLVPEAHFTHPQAMWVTEHAFGTNEPHAELFQRLLTLSQTIKKALLEFIDKFRIDVLVPQNILAIPMNLALSSAVYEVIKATGISTLAHHHDFYWERDYYEINCVGDLLAKAFPPDLPNVRHMVINSMAQKKLASMGIESIVMPNILDFDQEPMGIDDFNQNLRTEIGLEKEDLIFLQPTRVIPRKGIELSIELIEKLKNPRIKLLITHHAEYNSIHYLEEICAIAARARVPLLYLPARFKPIRQAGVGIGKVFSLWDAYIHADFVVYPSLYEGFGNALIEALFFRKPILVNRYQVFKDDIEPTGLMAVKIHGTITDTVLNDVRSLLADQKQIDHMTETNIKIAKEHFSFALAESLLDRILNSF